MVFLGSALLNKNSSIWGNPFSFACLQTKYTPFVASAPQEARKVQDKTVIEVIVQCGVMFHYLHVNTMPKVDEDSKTEENRPLHCHIY